MKIGILTFHEGINHGGFFQAYGTFSFLKSIHIYMYTDTEEEIEIAWKDNISSDAELIDMQTSNSALDKYVKSSSYKLRTEVVTRETLNQDIDILIDMTFQVTADPF